MDKIITIRDFENNKRNIKIKDFENVVRLSIEVVSWDEILKILRKDYSEESHDSNDYRSLAFFDDYYTIYDITKNIDFIKQWNKRKDSYNYDLRKEK